MGVPPALKVTVPADAAATAGVTVLIVAVKVTGWLQVLVVSSDVTAVVVSAAVTTAVRVAEVLVT